MCRIKRGPHRNGMYKQGENMSPARLQKKQEPKGLLEIYAPYIIVFCMIILVLLVIALCLAVFNVHAFQLTGTEANLHQNMEALI